jgi:hypothetical protein
MNKLTFMACVLLSVGLALAISQVLLSLPAGTTHAPAEQALREAMQHCGKAEVVWQASLTNEPGVVWFSAKCEVVK